MHSTSATSAIVSAVTPTLGRSSRVALFGAIASFAMSGVLTVSVVALFGASSHQSWLVAGSSAAAAALQDCARTGRAAARERCLRPIVAQARARERGEVTVASVR